MQVCTSYEVDLSEITTHTFQHLTVFLLSFLYNPREQLNFTFI